MPFFLRKMKDKKALGPGPGTGPGPNPKKKKTNKTSGPVAQVHWSSGPSAFFVLAFGGLRRPWVWTWAWTWAWVHWSNCLLCLSLWLAKKALGLDLGLDLGPGPVVHLPSLS